MIVLQHTCDRFDVSLSYFGPALDVWPLVVNSSRRVAAREASSEAASLVEPNMHRTKNR